MRPRKKDRHLPACVYHRNGAYYYVKGGQWRHIGRDLHAALGEYARIVALPKRGMAALIEEALPHILKGRADATVKQYRIAARRLQEILAEFSPEQVKPVHVAQIRRKYADYPSVGNRTITVLSLVFAYAVDEQLVDANPCVKVPRLEVAARTRLLSPGEYQAIYRQAGERLQVIMDLCYLTGQRIGDVLAIKRSDLLEDGIMFVQQKTDARLIVAWTPELRATVERAKALTGNVTPLTLFYGKAGRPPGYKIIWLQWKAACKAAGVANANIHDLRAMSGTAVDKQGANATALLGHSDAKMTKRYLRDRSAKVVHGPSIGHLIDGPKKAQSNQ
jgi:integrase